MQNNNITMEERLNQAFKKEEKGFLGFFIRNFRFTYLILIAIVLFGVFAIFSLPREANPEVKVPFALVRTIYPGASPTDVEDLVTNKLESKIKNLQDLKRYTSGSGNGFSSIFVEFEAEADIKESVIKLKDAVDEAKPELPDAAEDPVVAEVSFTDIPIVTYSLVGNLSEVELKKYADLLQDEFEAISKVSRAEILGGFSREYQVKLNQAALANFNISSSAVIRAISGSNLNIPVGNIEIDNFIYSVRLEGKTLESEEIGNIVVKTVGETQIYVRDVAEISDGFREKSTESRIGFNGDKPKSTISLQIYKQTGGNILDIVDKSRETIARLTQSGEIPANIKVQKTNDNAVFIRKDLKTLGTSGVQTFIFIVIILLAVLGFRSALLAGLSIPIAFLMAFIALLVQGETLNGMVLFSLVLSLGLMVDNSIVIMEGINEYRKKYNKSTYEAAILSVWNYKWPIISGTLTTVSAFVPMLLVSGILGEFLSVLPKTISATLLSSLFVALVVLPTLTSRAMKKYDLKNHDQIKRQEKGNKKVHQFFDNLRAKYTNIIGSIISNKQKRRKVLFTAWFVFVVSLAIPISGLMKVEMFPAVDLDYFIINIKLPVGSDLLKTDNITKQVEESVSGEEEVDNYVTSLGMSAVLGAGESAGISEHLASITVNLKEDRTRESFEVAKAVREKVKKISGAEIRVEELSSGPPTGSPIEIRITGENLIELAKAAEEVKKLLTEIPGAINARVGLSDAPGEFTFRIDREKASFYGLTTSDIAFQTRTALLGTSAGEINVNGEDVDITVSYPEDYFTNVDGLKNILIFSPTGESLSLASVADIGIEPSLQSIDHRDGERVIIVRADLEEGFNAGDATVFFTEKQKDLQVAEDINIELGGEVEDIEKSFQETFTSMIVAVILIAFILVLQFNSFRQPFIIIFTLPLALIGVIIGLFITSQPLSFPAFIGVVALSGIVVNDAIVLIDKINKNIRFGMEYEKAIVDAGIARMQPIFLTSATTVIGVFPLIFADPVWRSLSLTVIFGLVFSTFLTLIIVPVMYAGMCRKEKCQ